MTIMTSSWFVPLDPSQYARIGISRGTPRDQRGFMRYLKLNPGGWFNSLGAEEYRQRYYSEILNLLDPATVVRDIEATADGKIAALLCYEPSDPGSPWCHRGILSAWLKDTLDLNVYEIGQERCGCGHRHPKLAPAFREQGKFDFGDRRT